MIERFGIERIEKAAEYILSKVDYTPEVGIILGTGAQPIAGKVKNPVSIPYSEIPGFLEATNKSHAGKLLLGELEGKKIVIMQGRFHFYEGYTLEELSLPVYVLKKLGIKSLLTTNASGAVNTSYRPGDVMIVTDHIKLYGGSPMRGMNIEEMGPRFFGVTDMYSKALRKTARGAAEECSLRVHDGVYMFFPGPQFETPAEIRAARILGADAVGMSTVTEALTAAHCSLPFLCLSLITNMASGVEEGEMDGSEVDDTARSVEKEFSALLLDIVERITL